MDLSVEFALSTRLHDAISTTLNAFGAEHGAEPLAWTQEIAPELAFEGTHPAGRAHPDAEQLCRQWAEALDLTLSDYNDLANGYLTWTGDLGWVQIDVHCIIDMELYKRAYPEDEI